MNGQNGFRRGQMSLGSSNVESHPFQNRKRETKAVSELRKECRTWFNNHVRPACIGNREERSVIVEVYESGTLLTVRKRFLDETLAKNLNNCRLSETMEVPRILKNGYRVQISYGGKRAYTIRVHF